MKMYCPFINAECRSDCVFRHMARGATTGMANNTMTCALAILSDDLMVYLHEKTLQEEDQNS